MNTRHRKFPAAPVDTGRSRRIWSCTRAISAWARCPRGSSPTPRRRVVCGFCSTGCRSECSSEGRRGDQSQRRHALSGEPRHGLSERLGGAHAAGRAGSRHDAAAARCETAQLRPVDWDAAMTEFCARIKEIQAQHGAGQRRVSRAPARFAPRKWRCSAALFKFGMGGLHCDCNTRQCMATAHVAYKQSFGFDAPPFTYADFEESDVLVFVGANPCIAHPIMWQRVMRNQHQPEIIVVDPRKTETAMAATQHLRAEAKERSHAALRPGEPAHRQRTGSTAISSTRHTTGFEEFAEFVTQFTPERVCAETGLTPRGIWISCATTIADGKARFVLVDDGREPEPRSHAHRAGDHQSRVDDRQHRPARHRREFHHRPVQRDGLAAFRQHHQPARRT